MRQRRSGSSTCPEACRVGDIVVFSWQQSPLSFPRAARGCTRATSGAFVSSRSLAVALISTWPLALTTSTLTAQNGPPASAQNRANPRLHHHRRGGGQSREYQVLSTEYRPAVGGIVSCSRKYSYCSTQYSLLQAEVPPTAGRSTPYCRSVLSSQYLVLPTAPPFRSRRFRAYLQPSDLPSRPLPHAPSTSLVRAPRLVFASARPGAAITLTEQPKRSVRDSGLRGVVP